MNFLTGGFWTIAASPLSVVDILFAAAALAVLVGIARRCGPAGGSLDEAFLADRALPWWALSLSLVATEVSALTLVGVPAAVSGADLGYAQFFAGSLLGRLILAAIFVPVLCSGQDLTCYGWIKRRFGPWTAKASAAFFCIAKIASAALRLVALAVAASVVSGLGPAWWALLLCAAAAALIGYGGLRWLVWAGVYQALLVGAVLGATILYILYHTPGHVHGAFELALEGDRLAFWHGGPAWSDADFWRRWLTDPNIFWVAALNGLAGTLAAFGCDFDFAQKLMACRGVRKGRAVVGLATAGSFLALLLLLTLGVCLYAFYRSHPALAVPEPIDRLYPHFSATVLPAPLRGLALAALILAAVDLPLSGLSAVFVSDIWNQRSKHLPRRSRIWLAVFWSAVILATALWLFARQDMLWLGSRGAGIAAGPLLGLFLLGLLTRVKGDKTTVLVSLALASVFVAKLASWAFAEPRPVNWGWATIVGAGITFAMGYGLWRFYSGLILKPRLQ